MEHQRIIPEAKHNNYILAVKNQKLRIKEKAFEILYTFEGKVLEASTSNFFIVKNKQLITPKHNILIGTTRNKIIHLAKNKHQIIEKDIQLKDALSADEAFLTATNKGVVPVVKINSTTIGNGKVRDVTLELIDSYNKGINK